RAASFRLTLLDIGSPPTPQHNSRPNMSPVKDCGRFAPSEIVSPPGRAPERARARYQSASKPIGMAARMTRSGRITKTASPVRSIGAGGSSGLQGAAGALPVDRHGPAPRIVRAAGQDGL